MNAREAALVNEIAELRTQVAQADELRADIGGFPNLHAMRECMVETADENACLRAQVEALKELLEGWLTSWNYNVGPSGNLLRKTGEALLGEEEE